MSETEILHAVMIRLSNAGVKIFRNNQGVAVYPDGSRVRYGIANPGGSDLIGWVPVIITPEMVGQTVAVFVAAEVKTPRGRANPRQRRFLDAVAAAGGFAAVLRSEDDAAKLAKEASRDRQ